MFKSGFVAVLGVPNTGKSTLVNLLCGKKVSGVSSKPQTTRRRVMGVLDAPDCQAIFVDTPGYGAAGNRMDEMMGRASETAAKDADVILYVIDAARPESGEVMKELLRGARAQSILAVNKIDLVPKPALLPLLDRFNSLGMFASLVPVSALEKDGVDILLEAVRKGLPEGPKWFESGEGRDERATAALIQEVVQEKLFARLHQEIPYGCAVLVESVEKTESGNLLRVEAEIVTERANHKPILIGREGRNLKAVGTQARVELEGLLGIKVFLRLRVRVEKDWRNRDALLTDLGYAGD